MMKFEEFKNYVAENIKGYLPERYSEAEVIVDKRIKENGITLTGISVGNKGQITPFVYLESIYEDYTSGKIDIELVMSNVADTIVKNTFEPEFDVNNVNDYEMIKGMIQPRLLNYDLNKEMVKERPYVRIEDLVVTFSIKLTELDDQEASIPITNKLADSWGVTTDELYKIALGNLVNDDTVIFPLRQMIDNIGMPGSEQAADTYEIPDGNTETLILSNKRCLYGANIVLNDSIMNELLAKMENGFYLLPSSVHELLLIPKTNSIDVEDLRQMVTEVNNTVVERRDILSDEVYTYSKDQGMVIA